jgi:hypothetical protein
MSNVDRVEGVVDDTIPLIETPLGGIQPELRRNISDTMADTGRPGTGGSTRGEADQFTTITKGNMTIRVRVTPTTTTSTGVLQHTRQARENLKEEEKLEIFEKAAILTHKKYDLLSLNVNDEDKLDDTYNLEMQIRKTREAHISFDLQDVFNIIYPNPQVPHEIDQTKDLYNEYATITIEEVALSNRWYNTFPADSYYRESLMAT